MADKECNDDYERLYEQLRKDWLDTLATLEMTERELLQCKMDVRWWKEQYEAQFKRAQIAIGEAKALRDSLVSGRGGTNDAV